MPTNFPDAGYFGGPASLPSGAGPVDPPILTGNYPYPSPAPGNFGPADYWTRMDPNMGYINPSITIDPSTGGPANYPAPGGGGGGSGNTGQSILGRIFGSTPLGGLINLLRGQPNQIPAVRLARTIGHLLNRPQPWQQNAASNVPVAPALPGNAVVFGYDPSQGGGLQHYDPATGRVTQTPSLNPLYNSGAGWQPVGNAPADVRWQPNSGTGNAQADLATKGFQLGGGYAGVPNRPQPDAVNMFMPRGVRHYADEEGGIANAAQPTFDPATAAANVIRLAAARDLYAQAVKAVPYISGEGTSYTQRINDWIRAHQGAGGGGLTPADVAGLPPIRISGPPTG